MTYEKKLQNALRNNFFKHTLYLNLISVTRATNESNGKVLVENTQELKFLFKFLAILRNQSLLVPQLLPILGKPYLKVQEVSVKAQALHAIISFEFCGRHESNDKNLHI
ncbi:CLUMA_CG009281, isoform A [Clunio marinus]|uniref:CLUMA_CG009281, isoform A n=1 Tax=Clunio marinus TaxID=568069 RepID=A0A1J1IA44_9DIPT|nr:CLUMA_CG009281, isoform A [Clunio marinus]